MPTLLIIAHAPSDKTQQMAQALVHGAEMAQADSLKIDLRSPFDTDAGHVLSCAGIILMTTENFGYMSGALKDFFDRSYYGCLDQTDGLPYAVAIRAGNDGRGTRDSIKRIVTGMKWREVQPTLICRGDFEQAFVDQCETLGMTLAAGLDAGIF